MSAAAAVFLAGLAGLPLIACGLCLLRARHSRKVLRFAVEAVVAVILCVTLLTMPLEFTAHMRTMMRLTVFLAYMWPLYTWIRSVLATQLRWYDIGFGLIILATAALPFYFSNGFEPAFCDGVVSHFETCG